MLNHAGLKWRAVSSHPVILTVIPLKKMNSQIQIFAVIAFSLFIGGCSKDLPSPSNDSAATDPASQEIARIAESYSELTLMTPEPVFVNPELAMLCVGATKEMVDNARNEEGPHANCSVKIFMNELASSAFTQNTSYPIGAIIVKEKDMLGYRTKLDTDWQGMGSGVGGMIKREKGYDEFNGDWEYFYFDNPSSIESGKMKSCIECHRKAQSSDFVFAVWAKDDNQGPYGY